MNTRKTNNKGLTLIALIVTIIVLLLLAGVVINIVVDTGGLFEQAKTAKKKWNNSIDLEQAEIINLIKKAEYMEIKTGPYKDEVPEGYIPLYTAEDLAAVASNVPRVIKEKEYSMAPDANYIVMRHIDLSGYNYDNGGWTPIPGFCGNFDGNGCLIENLTIDRAESYQALFGAITGDLSNKKIENILLQKANIKGYAYSTGICSSITNTGETNFTIQNCRVGGKIEAEGPVSGIAQDVTKVDFNTCIVEAELISTAGANVAGIVYNYKNNTNGIEEIKDCTVIGNLTSKASVAGIVYGQVGEIQNCNVIGDINAKSLAVGIIYDETGSTNMNLIKNCTVDGNLTSSAPAVGIAFIRSGTIEKIESCTVDGNLTSEAPVAGINYGGTIGSITGCTVDGNLTTAVQVAGIAYNGTIGSITGCTVDGDINAKAIAAGIIYDGTGSTNMTLIKNCKVDGNLTGSETAGIAYIGSGTIENIENCTVDGNLTSAGPAAGINYGGTIDSIIGCSVKGDLTSTGNCVGGIRYGSTNITVNNIEDCTLDGNLTSVGPSAGICYNGGISNIKQCTVKGNITSNQSNSMGITTGQASLIEKCYVDATLVGKTNAMGIGPASTIKDCFVKGNMTAQNQVYGICAAATLSNSGVNAYMTTTSEDTSSGKIYGLQGGGVATDCFVIGTLSGNTMYGINEGGTRTNTYSFVASLKEEDEYQGFYAMTSASTGNTNTYTHARIINNENNVLAPGASIVNAELLMISDMKNAESFEGFDFENTWTINPNKNGGYPYPKSIEEFVGNLVPMGLIETQEESVFETTQEGVLSLKNHDTYYRT